jgi:hypothetical protein
MTEVFTADTTIDRPVDVVGAADRLGFRDAMDAGR